MAASMVNKREVLKNCYLGIPSLSRIIKSYQLCLGTGSCSHEELPGRRTVWTGIPISSLKGNECPIDSEQLEMDHLLSSTFYDPPWGMAGQTLPFNPPSFRTDLLLQPVCLPATMGLVHTGLVHTQGPWHSSCCLAVWNLPSELFFPCLLGKHVLIQPRRSCSSFCLCVLFFAHLASCRRAF